MKKKRHRGVGVEESWSLWDPVALRNASMEDVDRGETSSDLDSKRSERGQGASRETSEEAAAKPQERR